jgi:hypothetical protein
MFFWRQHPALQGRKAGGLVIQAKTQFVKVNELIYSIRLKLYEFLFLIC